MSQELKVQPYHSETHSARFPPKELVSASQSQGKTLEVQPYHSETYSARFPPKGLGGAFQSQGKTPFIRLWCRSRSGHHVTLLATGFLPYLYVDVSANVTEDDLFTIQRSLNRILDSEVRQKDKSEASDRYEQEEDDEPFMWIHHLEIVERTNFFGFHRPSKMLKIVLLKPNHVPYVRGLVWENNYLKVEDVAIGPLVYEANVQFHQRFAIDTKIMPFSWVRVNTDDMIISRDHYDGRTDLLACINYKKCQPLPFDSDRNNAIASFTTMTYDIEVCGPGRAFPKAQNKDDIVGLISYLMHRVGEKQSYARVSLIAGGKQTDPLPIHEKTNEKRELVVVPDEKSLLEEFAKGWRRTTPDFLSGYNTDGFDNGYVWDRAERYRMKEFAYLGRCPTDRVVHKKSNFNSKARGKTDDTNWEIPGTVSMDVLRLVRLEPVLKGSLRDFRLDAVSEVLLKDNKVPMDYKLIYPYYTGTPQQRSELADYCDHDAYLAHALMDKQAFIPCYIEMARVTGIRIHDLIVSGQQIKVQSQLLMFCHGTYLIPTIPTANDLRRGVGTVAFDTLYHGTKSLKKFTEGKKSKHSMHDFVHVHPRKDAEDDQEEDEYLSVGKRKTKHGKHLDDLTDGKDIDAEFEEEAFEGATVLDPIRAFYQVPITTLDFSSLYPSIIIENNLCYSTWLPSAEVAESFGLSRDDYIVTPTGDMFVKKRIREGVLPQVLKHLLTTRGKAKKDKAAALTEAKRLYELAKKAETEKERNRLILEAECIIFTGSVMDGRQLALKISANSCYGFTGVRYGILPLKAIARSVTSIGRTMIELIKNATEKFFSKARGFEHNAQVVYGDTDSIMIKFGYPEVQQGLDLGKRAADINNCLFWQKHVDQDKLTAFLESKCSEDVEKALWSHEEETVKFISEHSEQKSINLLLEKAFFPYLLINKKRYCGGYWLNGKVMDHVATAGIEATRRDNFLFLKTTLDGFIGRLVERDVPGAVTVLQQAVYDLYQGLVSWEDLTFSKGYNKDLDDYKRREVTERTHPVFVINARRKERGMPEHQKGNRVPYVYVVQAKTKGKEKDSFYLEDYEWARDHKMIPYIEHYIDFMTDPITRLLDVVLWEGATKKLIFSGEHTRTLRRVPAPTTAKLRADAMQVDPPESKNKQANVGSFFQMKPRDENYQRRLVKPMTAEELQKRKPSTGSIASFVK